MRREDIMVDRNLRGVALEKAGDIEAAIALYEANVRDRFDGSHPYDRLRVLYRKLGRIADLMRVARAYCALAGGDPTLKLKFQRLIEHTTTDTG